MLSNWIQLEVIVDVDDPAENEARPTYYLECVEEPNSPTVSCQHDNVSLTRTIYVPWEQLEQQQQYGEFFPPEQAVWDFCGYPTLIQAPNGVWYISRTVPDGHPDWTVDKNASPAEPTDEPFLYCTDVASIEPMGLPGNLVSENDTTLYEVAKMALEYKALQYDILTDDDPAVGNPALGLMADGSPIPDESLLTRYVWIRPEPAVEYLGLLGAAFKLVTSPVVAAPGTPGKIQSKCRVDVMWYEVPKQAIGMKAINPGAAYYPIDVIVGMVNGTPFANYPVGSLLCEAPTIEWYLSPLGQRLANVTFHFLYLGTPKGHNAIFYVPPAEDGATQGPGQYFEISTDGNTHTPPPLIIGVTSDVAPPLITTATPHNLAKGMQITITGVVGAVQANGQWLVNEAPNATQILISNLDGTIAPLASPYIGGGVLSAPWSTYEWGEFRDLFRPQLAPAQVLEE